MPELHIEHNPHRAFEAHSEASAASGSQLGNAVNAYLKPLLRRLDRRRRNGVEVLGEALLPKVERVRKYLTSDDVSTSEYLWFRYSPLGESVRLGIESLTGNSSLQPTTADLRGSRPADLAEEIIMKLNTYVNSSDVLAERTRKAIAVSKLQTAAKIAAHLSKNV